MGPGEARGLPKEAVLSLGQMLDPKFRSAAPEPRVGGGKGASPAGSKAQQQPQR